MASKKAAKKPDFGRPIFMTTSFIEDEELGMQFFFQLVPSKLLFPEAAQSFGVQVLESIVQILSEETGYKVALSLDYGHNGPDFGPVCAEIIIGTTYSETDESEAFGYIVSPLGRFTIVFYRMHNGAYQEAVPVMLTPELKQRLSLMRCESLHLEDRYVVQMVIPLSYPYPPLRPEEYIFGSPLRDYAEAYWERMDAIIEHEEQEHRRRHPCKNSHGIACAELHYDDTSLVDKIYGDIESLEDQVKAMLKRGDISSYRMIDVSEKEAKQFLDRYGGLIEEFLEAFGLDDEDLAEYADAISEGGQDEGYEIYEYVIRAQK